MGISRLSLNHLETQTVTLIKSDSKYPSPLKLGNAQVPLCHNEIFLKFSTKKLFSPGSLLDSVR